MSLVGSEYGVGAAVATPSRSKVNNSAFNSSSSRKMLDLSWSNKILNFYRHIVN